MASGNLYDRTNDPMENIYDRLDDDAMSNTNNAYSNNINNNNNNNNNNNKNNPANHYDDVGSEFAQYENVAAPPLAGYSQSSDKLDF